MLEKVVRLMGVLGGVRDHPFLKGKLALKGGTALNLFIFNLPRLSVDIDLNYVGAGGRDAMVEERPMIEQALQAVFAREDLIVRRMPGEHAGGKWWLRYAPASGRSGNLEVDLSFMYRVPLWPIAAMDSQRLGSWRVQGIPVVDIHELAAGKLCALLSRHRARDLFDSRLLLSMDGLDPARLRIAFVVYGAMNRKDWRTVSGADPDFTADEVARQLMPTLRLGTTGVATVAADYGRALVEDCWCRLSAVLPLNADERAFLDLLLDRGEVDPSLLTCDRALQDRIRAQPLLRWKAMNVRSHKGLD